MLFLLNHLVGAEQEHIYLAVVTKAFADFDYIANGPPCLMGQYTAIQNPDCGARHILLDKEFLLFKYEMLSSQYNEYRNDFPRKAALLKGGARP